MSKAESLPIDKIRVPAKSRKTLEPGRIQTIAESILDIGQQVPVSVRPEDDRFVLVDGLHRLEACKALGEMSVMAVVVAAESPQHRKLLSDSTELEAERNKMARLKQLRLEREAVAAITAVPAKSSQERSTGAKPVTSSARTSRTAAPSVSRPKSLSQWITQQKNDGGRY
ncbi:ParB N-terminal domain-containing protein [Bradyrhizobium sp. KB893862 SZCCT0404]|uniref:ParB N-terminal domain-containing protein n=1 Tax=Bradyrhizobium sp. KB893862 SZCCT0404 TaxID=2807672 RepID=UPI001BAAE5BF|nr:ParB N-terminal domain-containing protein [Bradyrhizobium sp. KB893862 SZCCT0404]MBR1177360.1 ParB N-terminal domain-containing protein [Bradyrhizobium sp. KB893862 SZCCT0404]